jgi:uncharacterized alkaline shock family protein YloU
MIKIQNQYGMMGISDRYLSRLLGNAVTNCFGVVGMAAGNAEQGIRGALKSKRLNHGILVRSAEGKLIVELHLILTYGINMKAIVSSIINKVNYTVENATGLSVNKVIVYVDDISD